MNIEETKREIISRISELEDENSVGMVKKMLEESLPPKVLKSREPGWGKGMITYVSEDFDDFIPPGFYGEEEDELSH